MKTRYGCFGEQLPEDQNYEHLMLAARVTWVHAKLLENCVLSRTSLQVAQASISTIVESFEAGEIEVSMLDPMLWATCCKVSGGTKA